MYGKRLRRALAATVVGSIVVTAAALASDVDVAVVDVTVPTNSVTLAPGASAAITINMSVTGNQVGTATFEVNRDWTLSGGIFTGSNPQEFTVAPRAGGDPATTFSTSGTVTVAAGHTAGPFTLAVGAFDITNSNATGAKLAAGDASNYQVTVSAPLPPSDTTPPVITPSIVGTLGNNGWYVSDVTVSWSVVDGESAISSSSGCDPTTISADTAGTTLTCTATSAGGTDSQSVTIKRDATAPTISGSAAPAPNGNGWNNTDVTVSYTCADNLSGVASCGPDETLSAEAAGQSSSGTAIDNAGNTSSPATVSGIDIDKTGPSVTCVAASFILNQPGAEVTAIVADGLSGPTAATASASADTSTVGTRSVDVTGSDLADNSTTSSCSYTVGYNFEGLYAPVDRPNTVNVSKAGQAIPLKWRLTDYFGVGVTNVTAVSVKATAMSCSLGSSTDLVEEYASGSSGLQNLGDGYYQFNWKTPTSYASSCKSIGIRMGLSGDAPLLDGLANFQFKK
jgi:hypothetical protein